jgi:hypothetical protein
MEKKVVVLSLLKIDLATSLFSLFRQMYGRWTNKTGTLKI